MSSSQLVTRIGQMEATAKAVKAEYRLQNGNLIVSNAEADLLGGHIAATYELLHLSGNSASRLNASLHDISLEAMNQTSGLQNRQAVRVSGRVDGTIGGTWTSNIRNGIAQAHITIRNSNQPAAGSSTIPLNGLIDVKYDGAKNVASFGQSYARTGNTTVSITGILSDRSQLNVQANTSDLKEVAALVSVFEGGNSATTNTASPLPTDLRGSARFTGQVNGSVKQPRIKGELIANDLELQNAHWRSLHLNLDAAASGVTLQNGLLQDARNGQISFSGHADLAAWSFTPTSSISLEANAKQVSISDLQQLTQSAYPVNGILAANISIHGTQQNPEGKGSIQVTQASAWNEPVKSLTMDFQGDGNSIHSNTQLAVPAGNLTAEVSYQPKSQSYDVNLHTATLKLDQLQSVERRNFGIAGNLTLSAKGHGTLKNPQLVATLQIPKLEFRDQVISDVQSQLNIVNQRAEFTLSSKADQGSIQAKGTVGLDGEYPATASLDVRAIPMAAVLAGYLPKNQQISGQAELHANLSGPLKNPDAIEAQLEIPVFNINYQNAQLGLVRPLRMSYRNGVATLDQIELKGTGTNLSLKGTIPVKAAGGPLSVSANGAVDLSLLQAFATGVQSSGRIDLDISARGDLQHPAAQGKINIVNARVSTATLPVSMEGMNGQINISGNRLEIAQLSGAAGGGTLTARGFMTYGDQSHFNLGLDAKSVRIRYPEGIRSVLTGNLALAGNSANSELTGRMLFDRLSFTQQFDLATLLGSFSTDTPDTMSSPFEQNMKLNVAVATAEDLNLASSKVSMAGAANLRLTGTMAFPVVLGRATLNSGEVYFMGKRYEIESGTIEFANPTRTVPVVNLYAKTTVQQYNVTLNFVGPVDRLRTNYTSDPPLPPADIINLVAFGKTTEQAATSPSTPATLGAESVLAQGAASQVSGRLERLTGISQLTINPLAGNSQSNPGAQVAIQQRVTGNILLTFSTDVTSTQNQAIQLQYQANKNVAVSVLRDQYGGYAADVRIHKTF
jgi:translocation and assembly module TamB